MLDLPTNTIAADMAVRTGDDIYAIHKNPADVGLFSRYAKVERVPIEAHTPIPRSRAHDDGEEYDLMSARPVEGYSHCIIGPPIACWMSGQCLGTMP